MAQQIPEGDFYSRLYVEPGTPKDDSARFRNRVGAFFQASVYEPHEKSIGRPLGQQIKVETGYQGFDFYFYASQYVKFFQTAPLVDVFTAITLTWRQLANAFHDSERAANWRAFIERAFKEENLKYRVDAKCGIHPFVDQEFERSRVSTLACLADKRYLAVHHAVETAFESLNSLPMDGKAAARSMFEAAEALTKTVVGSSSNLDERFVERELRPICDRLFNSDAQLKATAGRLLSSFSKWVDAVHVYRHGHERDQPLTLPDDLAILAVSQGAAFVRWLVDVDRRQQKKQ